MDEPTEPIASFMPMETSRPHIDVGRQREALGLSASRRGAVDMLRKEHGWMGLKPDAESQCIKRAQGKLSSVRVMSDPGLRQTRTGEQALYAVTARRFLEVSRYYLAIPYTGSRHWYPNGTIFSGSSAACRLPEWLFTEGEKHVVG
jgi:hypothetical protein